MDLPIELIIVLVVVIVLPILAYLLHLYLKGLKNDKADNEIDKNVIGTGYYPDKIPAGKRIYSVSMQTLIDDAHKIMEGFHTFGSDDITNIIGVLKNLKTKAELSSVSGYVQIGGYALMDRLKQGLKTAEQKKWFASWMNNLPDYI